MESLITVFVFIVTVSALPPSRSKIYRNDYVYNSKTDAFYKMHLEIAYRRMAVDRCALEGAQLMIPTSQLDIHQVHEMMKQYPDLGDLVWIGDDGQKHESAEETPVIDLSAIDVEGQMEENPGQCDVVTRGGEVKTAACHDRLPYVCKVAAKDAPYDDRCGVFGSDYTYLSAVRSCYKVPQTAVTWNEAFAACQADGAHLVVLNSADEARAVKEFLKTAPRVKTAKTTYFYFAGIRAERPTDGTQRVFKTIFNETLEEASYSVWSEGEPNNHNDSEYCGSIFSNTGNYNDVDCSDNYAYICEKETN